MLTHAMYYFFLILIMMCYNVVMFISSMHDE